jgi:hypothetical protein
MLGFRAEKVQKNPRDLSVRGEVVTALPPHQLPTNGEALIYSNHYHAYSISISLVH